MFETGGKFILMNKRRQNFRTMRFGIVRSGFRARFRYLICVQDRKSKDESRQTIFIASRF